VAEPKAALRMWLEKLKAPEPAVRGESIRELEMLGDTDALPALAEVFATDSEPELRMLAQWAGKLIYYGALQRQLDEPGASDEERRLAAEILARAQARKTQSQEIRKK
jgi:HEAT repeat protein